MQRVIDIPDKLARSIAEYDLDFDDLDMLCDMIKNGTPLPEHHGKLIDADALLKEHPIDTYPFPSVAVEGAPTIIPATDRTATWKRIGSDVHGFIDMYKCSNCGAHPPKKQIGVSWGWDFVDCCPKCGAKIIPTTRESKRTITMLDCYKCKHYVNDFDGCVDCHFEPTMKEGTE